jgi:SnoaL-like domain
VITGRDAAVEMIRGSLTNARTAHQMHTPLIELNGDEAQVIWAMQDRVVWENGPALTGYGHYHERWVRDAGGFLGSHVVRQLVEYYCVVDARMWLRDPAP